MSGEPPDSWSAWAELAGIATVGFAIGVIVGYARAPREQRRAVNGYVMERVSERTRTVLAVLKVAPGYCDYRNWEIAARLDDPLVEDAQVFDDRRRVDVPVQEDRRGTAVMAGPEIPAWADPRAF